MLTDHAEVPFGARALLKGIHVEGIWAPNCDSPASRDGTDKQGTYSAGEVQLPPQSVTAAQHTPYTGRHTRALSAATTHIQRPDTPDFENIPEDQPLKLEMGEDSRSRRQVTVDSNRPLSAWAGRRSSWILRPFEASKKSSRHEGKLSHTATSRRMH
ncbi:hypothetical protein BDV59DRAFT_176524 [Aspergillus ambiguus]|uniref:uncharacterized protein n=1 Tax=Aspergillus ambiguus TaxID=176160 RepID=UPI003CCD24EA